MTSLKLLRESQNMTQAELADRLNVSRSTVAMWETDKNIPHTKMLVILAETFGCTVDTLLGIGK